MTAEGEPPPHFSFRALDRSAADAIVSWRYEPPYDFYDLTADIDDLDEFLAESRWGTALFAADGPDGKIRGFVDLIRDGDVIEIGLGLRPDLTGQGLGGEFVDAILDFARARFEPREFRLKVAQFNRRAIRVYERAGFSAVREFVQHTNGGEWPFVEMVRPA